MNMTKYISLKEAGERLGFGSDKMYRMARGDPDFPVAKIGGQYRVSEEEFMAYIKSKYISKGGKNKRCQTES